jgi:CRISPR-associated protein Cmr1
MRKPPPILEPASTARKTTWSREARVVLITRLFGGGARTREIDKVSWLRSSAAKSALRSWWRAAHAHDFSSLEELRKREEELFGSSGTFDSKGRRQGGPGALEVTVESKLALPPADYLDSPGSPINYALFPAQKTNKQGPAKIALPSEQTWASIQLTSRSEDTETQKLLLEALSLWLTLGGVGSRSRRGVGAVALSNPGQAKELGIPVSLEELEAFLREHCKPRPVPAALAEICCLARTRSVFLGPPQDSGERAQLKLLDVLRKVRQERDPSKPGKYGRSKWPEPDAIRLKTDPTKEWKHEPVAANAGQYPRATLGLPIVMHFKDDWPIEPKEHQILAARPDPREKWKKLERFSSPVLLRPVRIWKGKQMLYVPVALLTDCTLPADARPLVTIDPKAPASEADVIQGYDLSQHAGETLHSIERAFAGEPGFRLLEGADIP